jgi:hypothetical protein
VRTENASRPRVKDVPTWAAGSCNVPPSAATAGGRARCPHERALKRAIAYAELSDVEKKDFNSANPMTEWGEVGETIVDRLRSKYARLLDIRVDGKPPDYLLWEVVGVVDTYADASLQPDAEHLCIAILAIEGVLSNVATANWDGLIETAVEELGAGAHVLDVCVRDDDFRKPRGRTRLLKFHGCAVRARDKPDEYRDLLIGRQSQIEDWPTSETWKVMRRQLGVFRVRTTR